MTNDYLIVGAGLTGLTVAHDLTKHFSDRKIQILEKSKGCGGRMATRRIDDLRFDHGAQFIKKSITSQRWIQIWKNAEVDQRFPAELIDGICGQSGLTQLAKVLAKDLNIKYDIKVSSISFTNGYWAVRAEDDSTVQGKNIIMTCPLPQSLELLQSSGLTFNSELSQIKYSKAVVVLIESDVSLLQLNPNYEENISADVFSACSQQAKGNTKTPAWTVVMSAPWSELNFDLSDGLLLEKACEVIRQQRPNITIKKAHLKKWKYCAPLSTWSKLFENPAPGLYLAGDSFGGPSLLGALRSSQELFNCLKVK
ncbi:MAG: FAD-dependent oxidoreductase [Bdellovibrio sp.]|nr:FAD-dependent oxidoreductase [Bdellovibrio sp.]